jgi:hypothetical protein
VLAILSRVRQVCFVNVNGRASVSLSSIFPPYFNALLLCVCVYITFGSYTKYKYDLLHSPYYEHTKVNEMSIKEFLDQVKGNWISTKTAKIGDTIEIASQPKIDNQSFKDKTYLVMDCMLNGNMAEPMKLRLSGQQTQALAPTFGDDAAKWVGKKIRIVAKTMYPGLGKEGFIYVPA